MFSAQAPTPLTIASPPLCRRQALAALATLAGLPLGSSAVSAAARSAGPALLLAREWPAQADPAGYLVSEKLDGVRALWDGRTLRFRGGGEVAAPAWFVQRLPAHPLDGELWLGRGQFDALSGLVRRDQPDDEGWRAISYQVFELPAAGGRFAERAQALEQLCRRQAWSGLQAPVQQPAADAAALQRQLQRVLDQGGEGLMLHHADAPQATGRGPWLYKHKPLHDAEATVLAHLAGQGRFAGLLGALQVRTDDGVLLAIGTGFSAADRRAPPPVGQRISFSHRGYTTGGVPRFASYLRLAEPL